MNRITKKQAAERKAAWSLALAEGRVLRHIVGIYPERATLTSYPTIEARDAALATTSAPCEIVDAAKLSIIAG